MAPRADEYEDDSTSGDDIGLSEEIAEITQACVPTGDGATSDGAAPTTYSDDDYEDDLEIARSVQNRLLATGDAAAPITNSDDDEESDIEYANRIKNLYGTSSLSIPAVFDDDEDDFEILRAIQKRFSAYDKGPEKVAEEAHTSSPGFEVEIASSMISNRSDVSELCPISQDACNTTNLLTENVERQPCSSIEGYKLDDCKSSKLPNKRSGLPVAAQVLFDAIKKNRCFQKFLRTKMTEMEAKIEENKNLRDRAKYLKALHASCVRRTGHALSQKKDPHVQLISAKKSSSNYSKINDKKISAMCYGPAENSHVTNYRMVLERFPLSLDRKKWSIAERENLLKGIRQQFQEMVLQISVDRFSSECSFGDAYDIDNISASIKDLEITPEKIREFLPKVNWNQLAFMYVVGRTGAECEARWLNCEDPLINHSPWTNEEDKFLLHIVQEMGIRNWFDITISLGTNRTPFQCLARYQRSLNPSMLHSEWTDEEDAQLCSAVATFGKSNWQTVASVLERRTGTQCSNRWKKSLCPERKGGFTPEEDERLTVAVLLFGRKWNQIAKFVPGRTQAQCRDRYVNSLDPSLKWGGWTEEEDSRLKAAITKYGYCWSKIAEDVPPRTDSQCRKRWKVLCPDQVPLLQAARKMRKAALISNFVDRESERPALSLNDFLPIAMIGPPSDVETLNLPKKQKRKSSNRPKKMKPRRRAVEAQTMKVQEVVKDNDVEICGIRDKHMEGVLDHSLFPSDSVLMTTNSQGELGGRETQNKFLDLNPRVKTKVSKLGSLSFSVQNGNEDEDNVTLACFLHNKSKKRKLECTKNLPQARNESESLWDVSKHLQNELSQKCGTGGTPYLSRKPDGAGNMQTEVTANGPGEIDVVMEKNVARHGEVRNSEDVNMWTDHDDGDMTLACFMRNKPKKRRRAAKGSPHCPSSGLKKGSRLPLKKVGKCRNENHRLSITQGRESDGGCNDGTPINLPVDNLPTSYLKNMPSAVADDHGAARPKLVKEQTVLLLEGVREPTNINMEGKNEAGNVALTSFLQKRPRKQRRATKCGL